MNLLVPLCPFPFILKMVHSGILAYIDIAIAERVLSSEPIHAKPIQEGTFAFVCYLSLAARCGHLCVHVPQEGNGSLSPSLQNLCKQIDDPKAIATFVELEQMIINGCSLLQDRCSTRLQTEALLPIFKEESRYYLKRFWKLESTFIDCFLPILQNESVDIPIDLDRIKASLEALLAEKKLLPKQRDAIICGCKYPFSVITGGPGTGKTYTAGLLLKALWEGMDALQRLKCRFVLAAPTGKAAMQLQASIARAMDGVKDFPSLQGKTLHSLLGVGKRRQDPYESDLAIADLILIDECSMIDAVLMTRLMQAVKPNARLVMLGDRFQLPPVESGSFFSDLVLATQDLARTIELQDCMRLELHSIVAVAESIKSKNTRTLFSLLEKATPQCGLSFMQLKEGESPSSIQEKLLRFAMPYFQFLFEKSYSPKQWIDCLLTFRILSPLRQGPLGVDALNAMFYRAHQAKAPDHAFVVPIMIAVNDPKLQLFNGEVGLLINREMAIFLSNDEEGKVREIPHVFLPKYEYAYCVSVHKSQGSEFDHVALLVPKGADHFGAEVLYTGVTRARKKLTLWMEQETVTRILGQETVRYSGLSRINNLRKEMI